MSRSSYIPQSPPRSPPTTIMSSQLGGSGSRFSDMGRTNGNGRSRSRSRSGSRGSQGFSSYGRTSRGRSRGRLTGNQIPNINDRLTIRYDNRAYSGRVQEQVVGTFGNVALVRLDIPVRVDGISYNSLHLVPSNDGYYVREFLRGGTYVDYS